MARKTAKQIVDEVVSKVNKEHPTKVTTPPVEHHRLCMTIVAPGSKCNCPESKK